MLIHSQDGGGAASNGGDLDIRPGALVGGGSHGQLSLQDGSGTDVLTITASLITAVQPIAIGGAPAQSGALRLTNNEAIKGRSGASDLHLMSLDGSSVQQLGDAANLQGMQFTIESGANGFQFIDGTTIYLSMIENFEVTQGKLVIGIAGANTPTISQAQAAGARPDGQTMLFHAQDGDGGGGNGGDLDIRPGALGGGGGHGVLSLQDGGGNDRLSVTATTVDVQVQFGLKSYNVAGAPGAAQAGRLIFVTDGDTGSPCLACDDGAGNWKVIALGANISAT